MLMVVFIADLEDFARLLILVIFFSVSIAEAIIAREPLPSPSRHCCHINSFFEGAVFKKNNPASFVNFCFIFQIMATSCRSVMTL